MANLGSEEQTVHSINSPASGEIKDLRYGTQRTLESNAFDRPENMGPSSRTILPEQALKAALSDYRIKLANGIKVQSGKKQDIIFSKIVDGKVCSYRRLGSGATANRMLRNAEGHWLVLIGDVAYRMDFLPIDVAYLGEYIAQQHISVTDTPGRNSYGRYPGTSPDTFKIIERYPSDRIEKMHTALKSPKLQARVPKEMELSRAIPASKVYTLSACTGSLISTETYNIHGARMPESYCLIVQNDTELIQDDNFRVRSGMAIVPVMSLASWRLELKKIRNETYQGRLPGQARTGTSPQ